MSRFSIGQCAELACLLEVTASKPGNVHRGADLEGLTFDDFVISAVAIGPIMNTASTRRLGATVADSIRATRQFVTTNTNLGIVLLLAPLCSVPWEKPLRDGVAQRLSDLDSEDAKLVYQAIGMAQPGGMGRVNEHDLAANPPADLLEAMRAAAPHDMVARQYGNNFSDIFDTVVPWLLEARKSRPTLGDAIVHTHLRLMSRFPDSLIGRKCGGRTAQEAADRAASVLSSEATGGEEAYLRALSQLDFWLRSDGNRRNPGTTADLIASGLFVALRENLLVPTYR